MTLLDAAAWGQIISPVSTVVVVYLAYRFAIRQMRKELKIEVYSTLMGTRHCLDGSAGSTPEKAQFNAALNRATAVFGDSEAVTQELENVRISQDKTPPLLAMLQAMHRDVYGKTLPNSAFQNFLRLG